MCLLLSVINVNYCDFMFNNYIIVVKKWVKEVNPQPSQNNLPNSYATSTFLPRIVFTETVQLPSCPKPPPGDLHSLVYHSLTREFPSVMDVVKL